MNSNVRDTGFAGLPEMEAMQLADDFNMIMFEQLPIREIERELCRSVRRNLPVYFHLFRRMDECQSGPDGKSSVVAEFLDVVSQEMYQILDKDQLLKVQRLLQFNYHKEHMNSELPKILQDKLRDFNMAMRNFRILILKTVLDHMSEPKQTSA
ncbi:hypothetical protein M3Y96_00019800 [Aphelenchoides besseyi]|nr:hypothetical protein M3Y96_00019800 [Aphelenchoides besseyi]